MRHWVVLMSSLMVMEFHAHMYSNIFQNTFDIGRGILIGCFLFSACEYANRTQKFNDRNARCFEQYHQEMEDVERLLPI